MSYKKRKWKYDSQQRKVVEIFEEEKPIVDAPWVKRDEIDATMSYATDEGLVFESKSKLRRHYKQHGYEDTGGDHYTGKAPELYKTDERELRNDIAESMRKIEWGMAPQTEKEKERCLREERSYQKYKKNR